MIHKSHFRQLFCVILIFLCYPQIESLGAKTWDYALNTIEVINENPEYLDLNLKATRMSRGVYGVSGNFTILSDMVDEKLTISLGFYRSARNDGQYMSLPGRMEKTVLFDFMNKDYKKFIMPSVKDCTTLPVFEGAFDKNKYAKKGKFYEITNCLVSEKTMDQLPNHLQTGFYKVVLEIERPPQAKLTVNSFVEIKSKF